MPDYSRRVVIEENSLRILIEISSDGDVSLLHFGDSYSHYCMDEKHKKVFRLVEVQITGEDHNDHHDFKHTGTLPGHRLKYQRHNDYRNEIGRKVEIEMLDSVTLLHCTVHFQLYESIPVVRAWTQLRNEGDENLGLEYVSSFSLTGLAKQGVLPWESKIKLHIPHNTWSGEAQWKSYYLPELGLSHVDVFSLKRLNYKGDGTWSTSQYLPMGFIEDEEVGAGLMWQIENNGAWHWELSDVSGELYLQLSGPTEAESGWWTNLKPGERFETVPVAVVAVNGGFEKGIEYLNKYRRRIRRYSEDNIALPVIFNDYMNCLFGDPTTEKLIPLVDTAAEVGCEYFCIDAGWYSDGEWWDGVGEWLPSDVRFPNGISEILNYIKTKGMIPGLWLEIEVMGVRCRLADDLPDEWFFCRHGKRVIDHGRYQLDFRNPEVREFATKIIERLVGQYGVGYIKMDYNINIGSGTEIDADSFGDGLLEHNRSYLNWLDSLFDKFPRLTIENCSSGGMRLDYAMLSRHSIQSITDQTDYRKNAIIAASSPSAATPEQSAIWSYPLEVGDREEVIFNMVNAMLVRIHQSGQLDRLDEVRKSIVKEGLAYYKSIRSYIPNSKPVWPLGLPSFDSEWTSLGLVYEATTFMAVWRLRSKEDWIRIPFSHLRGKDVKAVCTFPKNEEPMHKWNRDTGILSLYLPQPYTARILELSLE